MGIEMERFERVVWFPIVKKNRSYNKTDQQINEYFKHGIIIFFRKYHSHFTWF
jgi:hypothetical protein